MQHNSDESIVQDKLSTGTLLNKNGMNARVTSLGGKLMSLWVPDKNGVLADVVLGYDSAEQYINGNPYFGAMIGRYGNRIAKGKFKIDDKEYSLALNNGNNSLHGGPRGFHNVNWQLRQITPDSIELYYLSKDGEEGYPGNMKVKVTYSLTDENELVIGYEATTDQPTVINLTHHSFFNLSGEGNNSILDHILYINADSYTPVDEGLIPDGRIVSIKGTPFDFTNPTRIGERIDNNDVQLTYGRGYDHNWILKRKTNDLELAAKVVDPKSGRMMEVWTTEPGLQFYSGNFLDGNDVGKGGKKYPYRSAFCLEAQHFPDSPNQPAFPSTVLQPNQVYRQTTIYKFSAE
ncbi:MAG: galactose mutarotase [Cyclobacteriaceae bacterium]|nr:galactose mutarotase [Cyclobacteriaceae bacterium]